MRLSKSVWRANTSLLVGALAVAATSLSDLRNATAATLTAIGQLPTPADDLYHFYSHVSAATALSGDGTTAIGHQSIGQFAGAFHWTRTTGFTEIGNLLTTNSNENSSWFRSVSHNGEVVVGMSNVDTPMGHPSPPGQTIPGNEAARWTGGDGLAGLGDLPGGLHASYAFGISDDASTIVGAASDASYVTNAARWTAQNGPELLDQGQNRSAVAVSADGRVIIGNGQAEGNGQAQILQSPGIVHQALVWEDGFPLTDLGDLPGGDTSSYATAVSADGSTVVGYSASEIGNEAFRWTRSGGIVALTLAPGGIPESSAVDVNEDGSVVLGMANIGDPSSRVFLWSEHDGMHSIRFLLEAQGVDTAGWNFTEAIAISNNGQVVLGNGVFNGKQVAWLADLSHSPEPSSVALAAIAILAVGRYSRARRSFSGQ